MFSATGLKTVLARQVRRFLAAQVGELQSGALNSSLMSRPVTSAESVWYAGMVIDPTEFSQQLSNLQTAIQRENATVRARLIPVEETVHVRR